MHAIWWAMWIEGEVYTQLLHNFVYWNLNNTAGCLMLAEQHLGILKSPNSQTRQHFLTWHQRRSCHIVFTHPSLSSLTPFFYRYQTTSSIPALMTRLFGYGMSSLYYACAIKPSARQSIPFSNLNLKYHLNLLQWTTHNGQRVKPFKCIEHTNAQHTCYTHTHTRNCYHLDTIHQNKMQKTQKKRQ